MKRTNNMKMKSKMKLLDAAEGDLIVQVLGLKGSQRKMKMKKIHLKTFLEEGGGEGEIKLKKTKTTFATQVMFDILSKDTNPIFPHHHRIYRLLTVIHSLNG